MADAEIPNGIFHPQNKLCEKSVSQKHDESGG